MPPAISSAAAPSSGCSLCAPSAQLLPEHAEAISRRLTNSKSINFIAISSMSAAPMQADTETFGPHRFRTAIEHQRSEEKNERPALWENSGGGLALLVRYAAHRRLRGGN